MSSQCLKSAAAALAGSARKKEEIPTKILDSLHRQFEASVHKFPSPITGRSTQRVSASTNNKQLESAVIESVTT